MLCEAQISCSFLMFIVLTKWLIFSFNLSTYWVNSFWDWILYSSLFSKSIGSLKSWVWKFVLKILLKLWVHQILNLSLMSARTHVRLLNSFLTRIFLQSAILEKEYIKQNLRRIVDKVVEHITRGRCISTNLMKSLDGCSNFIHNTGVGEYVESDKTNTCTIRSAWKQS